jgi:hypothetical protein
MPENDFVTAVNVEMVVQMTGVLLNLSIEQVVFLQVFNHCERYSIL